MATDVPALLAQVPLLAGIERKHIERLARSFRSRDFLAGATITAEGDTGVGFFVIVNGTATVTVGGAVRAKIGPGDAIGEMALIDDGPRTATVVADTDLTCLVLSPWDFRPFVEENPSVAWHLLQALAKRLRTAGSG